MRAASDVTADTPTPKHAARCNGCPVSVWGYTCSCSVAEPIMVRERWGNSDTFGNSVDKALGCKLRGMSERQQPCAKILHTLTTGGAMDPPPRLPLGSALACWNNCYQILFIVLCTYLRRLWLLLSSDRERALFGLFFHHCYVLLHSPGKLYDLFNLSVSVEHFRMALSVKFSTVDSFLDKEDIANCLSDSGAWVWIESRSQDGDVFDCFLQQRFTDG